ncbi:MAG: hypothetical protein AB7P04_09740 [Bacteriovoracia bacterium]
MASNPAIPQWSHLMNESFAELVRRRLSVPPGTAESVYVEAWLAFSRGQRETLGELASMADAAVPICLLEIIRLQIAILERSLDPIQIRRAAGLAAHDPDWIGEVLYVSGLAWETAGELAIARDFFRRAATALEQIGASRKSLQSFFHFVAVDQKLSPEKSPVAELEFIAQRALHAGYPALAGTALGQVALEYEKAASFEVMLQYWRDSATYLEAENGSREFYQARLHFGFALAVNGYRADALRELRRTDVAFDPEIRGAREVLGRILRADYRERPFLGTPDPIWRARYRACAERAKQAIARFYGARGLEARLLQEIQGGPKTKHELIETLYGTQIDYFSGENRLKNVISRLRRRLPGVLSFHEGRYRVGR